MKIGIVGAGNVGATIASILIMKDIADIYLLDIASDMAKGKAIDLNQSKFLFGAKHSVRGGDSYAEIVSSDIIVITAGLARKPGMTRDDLLFKNFDIMKEICLKIKESKNSPVVIVVSNPLDIMAYTAFKVTGLPKNKILGMAGILDSYRYMHYIEEKIACDPRSIEALTLGSHGDTMVPITTLTKVGGKPLYSQLGAEEITAIEEKTKNGGAEIVALLKTGSAYYAPAASTVRMIEAIVADEKATLPCSVYVNGEYGIKDIFIGLPVVLGKDGVSKIVEMNLAGKESSELAKSAVSIKEQIDKIKDRI